MPIVFQTHQQPTQTLKIHYKSIYYILMSSKSWQGSLSLLNKYVNVGYMFIKSVLENINIYAFTTS